MAGGSAEFPAAFAIPPALVLRKASGFDGPQVPAMFPLGRRVPSRATVAHRPRIRRAPSRSVSRFQRLLAAGQPVVEPEGNLRPAYLRLKRAMDVVGALVLLVLLSPVMLTVYVVLWISTRGRPIFCQVRLGWCGRPFVLYKFRTMALNAEDRQREVPNEQAGPVFKNRCDPRVTWFGRILRRTSLDETPQLLNVLAGQMSLVGPRPPLAKEVAQYEPWQRRRLAVKPGLTCLWQVSGRSQIGFEDWVRMDLRYARQQGVWADVKLLLRTPWSVLTGRGAY